jgi:hypothetical protein
MSITNYAGLQTAVQNWLHRSDLNSITPDLIRLGELRIFRQVRSRVMESQLAGTIASGVLALPADYLDLKFSYIDSSPVSKLSRASASQIYEQYPLRSGGGKPTLIAREGTNFIFGPYPDAGYSVKGIYYAKPVSIASSANAVFTAFPDLYLFSALCEATPYIKDDPRLPLWEAKYAEILRQIKEEDTDEYGSGAGMAVRAV